MTNRNTVFILVRPRDFFAKYDGNWAPVLSYLVGAVNFFLLRQLVVRITSDSDRANCCFLKQRILPLLLDTGWSHEADSREN